MKINNQVVVGSEFAYDGCHKIYIIENAEDKQEVMEIGYDVLPIEQLEEAYDNSCDLRFINNWALNKSYVGQFEEAVFQ